VQIDLEPFLNPQTGFLAFAVTALVYVAYNLRHQYEERRTVEVAAATLRAEEWKERALEQSRINEAHAKTLADNNQLIDVMIDRLAAVTDTLSERQQDGPEEEPPPPKRGRRT